MATLNEKYIEILLRQIQKGNIEVEDIKDNGYKTAVAERLEG